MRSDGLASRKSSDASFSLRRKRELSTRSCRCLYASLEAMDEIRLRCSLSLVGNNRNISEFWRIDCKSSAMEDFVAEK